MKFNEKKLKMLIECAKNQNSYEWWSQMPIRMFAETVLNKLNMSFEDCRVEEDDYYDRLVNRDDVRSFVRDSGANSLGKVLFVLGWGGMRITHAATALSSYNDHWKGIVDDMISGNLDRYDAYKEFHVLKNSKNSNQKGTKILEGMGPAYFTKLIFFLEKYSNGYIMDQWTSRSMNLLRQDSHPKIHLKPVYKKSDSEQNRWKNYYVDSVKNDVSVYKEFCEDLECLANRLAPHLPKDVTDNENRRAEATEQLIFSSGRVVRVPIADWRRYVLDHTS